MWFILFPRLALFIFDYVWKNGNVGLENLEFGEFLSKQYRATRNSELFFFNMNVQL